MKNGFFLILITLLIGACAGSKSVAEPVKALSLQVNEKANYQQVVITLTQINDARCPMNVRCVRAGEAIASFNVIINGKTERNIQLCAGSDCERRGINTQYLLSSDEGKYKFTLDSITPNPSQTLVKTTPRAYLRIEQSL